MLGPTRAPRPRTASRSSTSTPARTATTPAAPSATTASAPRPERAARHGRDTGSGGGAEGYLRRIAPAAATDAPRLDLTSLEAAASYDALHDPDILSVYSPPPPAADSTGGTAMTATLSGAGGHAVLAAGPARGEVNEFRENPFQQRTRPVSGPLAMHQIKTRLKLSASRAAPTSALPIDPAKLARSDQDKTDSLPDFRGAFADAVTQVRRVMASLDQATRDVKRETVDTLGIRHRHRQRSLDLNLLTLGADLQIARMDLCNTVEGWVEHIHGVGIQIGREFGGAAAAAKKSLEDRKTQYDSDLSPVVQERGTLITQISDGESALFTATQAASTAMESIRTNPAGANLESVNVPRANPLAAFGIDAGGESSDALLTRATREAIIDFLPSRADLVKQRIADNYTTISETLFSSMRCIPCKIDSGIAGIAGFVHQVSVIGPQQVDDLLTRSTGTLHSTIRDLSHSAREAGEAADTNLVESHDAMREVLGKMAEAEEQSEIALAEAHMQGAIDRLEANRDSLPLSVEGVRKKLVETARTGAQDPSQFAAQAMETAFQLRAQVLATTEREEPRAEAATEAFAESLEEQADAGDGMRRDQLEEARRGRRDTVERTGIDVQRQLDRAAADLRKMTGGFAQTASQFLPPVDQGYSAAVTAMRQAIDEARTAVETALTGHATTSPGTPPPPAAPPPPAPGAATTGAGGTGTGTGTPAQPPPPDTCAGCGPAEGEGETAETTSSEDSSSLTCSSSGGETLMSGAPGDSGGMSVGPDVGGGSGGMSLAPNMSVADSPMSPSGYAAHMNSVAGNPLSHDVMQTLITDAQRNVPGELGARASQIRTLLDVYLNADIDAVLAKVEGITRTHGQYFEREYGSSGKGKGLRGDFNFWVDQEFSWNSTKEAKKSAFGRGLDGDVTGAAIANLTAAMVGWNDSARMESIMNNLTPAQIAGLRALPPDKLAELRDGMNEEELQRFNLMLEGRTDEVRAMSLRRDIDRLRNEEGIGERGAESIIARIRRESEEAGSWDAEVDAGRRERDLFRLEDAAVRAQRTERRLEETENAFAGLDGVTAQAARSTVNASTNAGSVLLGYATASRTYEHHEYDDEGHYLGSETRTETFDPDRARVLTMAINHGFDSEEAAAAELFAETHRTRGPPRPDIMRRLLQPGEADAVHGGGYDAEARANGLEVAERKRARIFELYGVYSADSLGLAEPPSAAEVQAQLHGIINTTFREDANARDMMNGWVDNARGNPLATIEYAIAHENFDVARAQLGRMDRTEIDRLIADWNAAHPGGPSFEQAMGLGNERFNATDFILPALFGTAGVAINTARGANYNWNAAFSGDEANELELLMNGVPQNDFEAGHVALRTMDMQIEQSTWAGRLLANREYNALVENAGHLRSMMGNSHMELDSMGRIRSIDPATGQPLIVGNFNADGSFEPPRGATAGDFSAAMGLARFYADNYTQAVDRVANFIATAIVLTAAIATTFLTGGAAASIWIPMLVTMGAGVLAMGTTAMLKGSRYSKDQMLTDLATNVVSAATAGLGGAATAYLRGAATFGRAGGMGAVKALATSWRVPEQALATAAARGAGIIPTVADDVSRVAIGVAGATDDAARLAAGAAGATDDAARLATGAAGAVDDAARMGSSAASAADDVSRVATGAAGTVDDAARLRQLGQATWYQTMLVGGLSNGASGATAAFMDPANRRGENFWTNVLHGFGRGFVGGAAGAGISHGLMQFGGGIPARFLVGGLSGSLSKGAEFGYDRYMRNMRVSADLMAEEMFQAGLQSGFQSGMEGVAEGARRRWVRGDDAEHRWVEHSQEQDRAEEMARRRAAPEAANDNEPAAPSRPADTESGTDDNVYLPNLTDDTPLARAIRETMLAGMSGVRGPGDDAETMTAKSLIGTDPPSEASRRLAEQDPISVAEFRLYRRRGVAVKELFPVRLDGAVTADTLNDLGPLPAGSRAIAADPHNRAMAEANYHAMRRASPDREVGLFHHPDHGYVVVQGFHAEVSKPGFDYTTLRHSHPRFVSAGEAFAGEITAILARILPSGQDGDMGLLQSDLVLARARAAAGEAASHESHIDITVNGVDFVTTYRARDTAEGPVFDVTIRNPLAQGIEHISFSVSSHVEYHNFVLTFAGVPIRPLTVAEAVQRSLVDGSPTVTPAVMRVLRETALAPHERTRIDDFMQSMEAIDRFALQLEGRMPFGGLDPVLGMEFHRGFADRQLRDLGLVGQPDSVVRLHRILNDLSIPFPTRERLAGRVRETTETDMRQRGLLGPDEPLALIFHGRRRPLDEAMAYRDVAGPAEDLASGLYVTQDLASAYLYDGRHPDGPHESIPGRGRNAVEGATGEVLPFFVRGSELGQVVDVQPGGPHHAAWMDFLDGTPRRYPPNPASFPGMFDQFPTTRAYLDSVMGNADYNSGRGRVFQHFLDATPGLPRHPDMLFGELGGYLTNGIQLSDRITTQGAMRSQRLVDHINLQHGFTPLGPREAVRWPLPSTAEAPTRARANVPTGDGEDVGPAARQPATADESDAIAARQRRAERFDEALETVIRNSDKSKDLTATHDRLRYFLAPEAYALVRQLAMEVDPVRARALFARIALTVRPSYNDGAQGAAMVSMPGHALLHDVAQFARQMGSALRRVADAGIAEAAFETMPAADGAPSAGDAVPVALSSRSKVLTEQSDFARKLAATDPDQFNALVVRFHETTDARAIVASAGPDMAAQLAARFETYAGRALPQLRRHDPEGWSGLRLPEDASGPQARPFAIANEEIEKSFDIPVIGQHDPNLEAATRRQSEDVRDGRIKVGEEIVIQGIGRATVTEVKDGRMTVLPHDGSPATTILVTRQPSTKDGETVTAQTSFSTEASVEGEGRLPVVAHAPDDLRQRMLAHINRLRRFLHLADYSQDASGTFSIARGGGVEASGINATLAASFLFLRPSHRRRLQELLHITSDFAHRFIHHAEAASLMRLRDHLGERTMPKVVELFVDRPTCESCIANLGKLAKHLGIEELHVHVVGVEGTPPLVIRAAD